MSVAQLTSAAAAAALPRRRAAHVIALSHKEAERRDSKLSFPFARRNYIIPFAEPSKALKS